ncbi:MAG: hypothetical protein Q4D46_11205 [Erysipelotrichaceae bacterium]|nr:hypothetical protein [Erysipelotrichaceae bacterium]MDO5122636.1 hypothetical protein [Erysipelotrichaceae bacterium]
MTIGSNMPYMINFRMNPSAGRRKMLMVSSGLVKQFARNMIRNECLLRTPVRYAAASSKISVRVRGYRKIMIDILR